MYEGSSTPKEVVNDEHDEEEEESEEMMWVMEK